MKRVLNLTIQSLVGSERALGIYDFQSLEKRETLFKLLDFKVFPNEHELVDRAKKIAELAVLEGAKAALIEGPPYLLTALEYELWVSEIMPMYYFCWLEELQTVSAYGKELNEVKYVKTDFVIPKINRIDRTL